MDQTSIELVSVDFRFTFSWKYISVWVDSSNDIINIKINNEKMLKTTRQFLFLEIVSAVKDEGSKQSVYMYVYKVVVGGWSN